MSKIFSLIMVILLYPAFLSACKTTLPTAQLAAEASEAEILGSAYEVSAKVEEAYATGRTPAINSALTEGRVSFPTSDAGQAFTDQKVVFPFPRPLDSDRSEQAVRLKEVVRSLQAYAYIRELIWSRKVIPEETRRPLSDKDVQAWQGKGVVSLESLGDQFYGVRVGQGNSNNTTKRRMIQLLTAYSASADFNEIQSIEEYSLVDKKATSPTAADLAERFGVSEKIADKALRNISAVRNASTRNTAVAMMVPFWHWEEAVYTKSYAPLIKQITGGLLQQIAQMESPNFGRIAEVFRDWAMSTHIDAKIEEYLRPRRRFSEGSNPNYYPVPAGARVDPNSFDKGIEFSASFQIVSLSNFTNEASRENGQWLESTIAMTPKEREAALFAYAVELGRQLGSKSTPTLDRGSGGHGHGLELAYELLDAKGRLWRIEWDGVGRGYDKDGKIIPGSPYGGHLELVTPKFKPNYEEYQAVFAAMQITGMTPRMNTGGGHHNIDLAVFAGNPRAFARFLSLYLKYQGIITFLLQSEKRLWAAEPITVTKEFAMLLGDFKGTELELKQELYTNRFFNTRVGRKARYFGIDVSAYIQDIIPEEYISADYDIKSPTVKYRPSFNVNPKIRKVEARSPDAPRTAFEAVLHELLFKGLVSAAINETAAVRGNPLQKVDHRFYADNPKVGEAHLAEMARELGIDAEWYKPLLHERININRDNITRAGYTPIGERLAAYPRQPGIWGTPLAEPRPADQALKSSERPLESLVFKPPMSEGAERAASERQSRANVADVYRDKIKSPVKGETAPDTVMGTSPALDVPSHWCPSLKRLYEAGL